MGWFCKIFIITLATSGFASSSENILKPPIISEKDNMAECLLYIAHYGNLPFVPNIQIRIESQSSNITEYFMLTVEKFRENYKNLILNLMSDGNGSFDINLVFFFVDSLKSLEYLVESQQKFVEILGFESLHFSIIILPKKIQNLEKSLKRIFDFCWHQSISNVLVLLENDAEEIVLYTFYPFLENKCRNFEPKIHNIFVNGSFALKKRLFPHKTNNLQQCPVKVIVWTNKEFISPNRPTSFDNIILSSFSIAMNFSLQYEVSPHGIGNVFSRTNITNDFKMLHDGLGDIIIGTWCSHVKSSVFGIVPYGFENELIVFKQPKKHSSLNILFFPFDICTWITLLVLSIFNLLVQLAWRRTSKNLNLQRKCSKRFFIATWILSTFILRSCYEGLLFKFLHNIPRKDLPRNIDETIQQGYKLIVSNKNLYYGMDDIQSHMIEVGNTNMYETFYRLDGEKYSWIIAENYLASYKNKGLNLHIAEKPLLSYLQCIYTPKISFLTLELINKLSVSMIPYGFYRKLKSISKMKRNNLEENDTPVRLSLEHLYGAFYLYLFLSCVSLFIFALERFIKLQKNKN